MPLLADRSLQAHTALVLVPTRGVVLARQRYDSSVPDELGRATVVLVILTQMGWGRGAGRPGKTEPGEPDRAKPMSSLSYTIQIVYYTIQIVYYTDTITAEVGQSNYGLAFTDLRTPEHRRLRYIVMERRGRALS